VRQTRAVPLSDADGCSALLLSELAAMLGGVPDAGRAPLAIASDTARAGDLLVMKSPPPVGAAGSPPVAT